MEPSSPQKVIQIHPQDNVLVALANLIAGEIIVHQGNQYILKEDIPAKHKFFMQDFVQGQELKMYGVTVGKVNVPEVFVGQRMTVENTKHAAGSYANG